MKKRFGLILIVGLMLSASLVSAQADTSAPYLYYYSRMLGGIIIEHPDGSDSRLIGAGVIPPGLTGLSEPGWSPSGKYFAAYGVQASDNGSIPHGIYVMDQEGNAVNTLLSAVNPPFMDFDAPASIVWSPNGDDLLFVVSDTFQYNYRSRILNFWLVRASTGEVIASDGGVYSSRVALTNVAWSVEQQQLYFYIASSGINNQYFRVTMQFDGTVLKEPITVAEFDAHYIPSTTNESSDDLVFGRGLSPSGNFSTYGNRPTVLQNHNTDETVELPNHSQGTFACRQYRWSQDEQYIMTLDGTLVAGGGCGSTEIGITDLHGQLWRELGGCSWDSVCAGWLPASVDVSALPAGQSKPVQLDPIAYEPSETLFIMGTGREKLPDIHLRCSNSGFDVVNNTNQEILFQLADTEKCPYHTESGDSTIGPQIAIAYDSSHKLLATYVNSDYVTLWSMQTTPGKPILRLNTYGYQLEFTSDNKQLRARNVNAWKIYNVADILAAAGVKN